MVSCVVLQITVFRSRLHCEACVTVFERRSHLVLMMILLAAFALSLQKASAPEGFTPQLPFINEFRFNALDDDDDD